MVVEGGREQVNAIETRRGHSASGGFPREVQPSFPHRRF